MSFRTNSFATLCLCVLLTGCGGGGSAGGDDGNTSYDIVDALPVKRGLLPSLSRSDANFAGKHHVGSGVCSDCHNDPGMNVPTDTGVRKDVSIGSAWQTSMMANGTRDPYWHAVVASELDEFPNLEDEINDTCIRCHAPMAYDLARKEGLDLRLFDKGSVATGDLEPGLYDVDFDPEEEVDPAAPLDPMTELFNHGMDGISCSLCHQIDAGNLGTEQSMTGGYEIVDQNGSEERPAYGQYADPSVPYMQSLSGYVPQQGVHLSTSESCATCHNLNVEPVDTEGEPVGGDHFAEQANYTEWQYSDYRAGGPLEATCQSCHMPKLDRPVQIAGAGNKGPRDDFAEHTFLGANTVMQSMLRDFAEELGVATNILRDENGAVVLDEQGEEIEVPLDFDESIERNRAFLQSAASLSIGDMGRRPVAPSVPVTDDTGDAVGAEAGAGEGTGEAIDDVAADPEPEEELSFEIDVVNEAGHKLPTGYHSRRVYLHVLVAGDEGVVWESGRIDVNGKIGGLSEDVNPDSFEVHYDEITDASQVQVYQAVVGNSDGDRTHSLLNGDRYLKDNRILPKGYSKAAVQADPNRVASFGTFGAAMADDDFDNGGDKVRYRIRVPAGGNYRVLAELRYQPLAYGHIQQLFLKSDRIDAMDRFRTIYDAQELRDEVIATSIEDVPAN